MSDGAYTETATVTVNLNDLNEPPVIADQSFSVNENAPRDTVAGTVLFSDPDPDRLTVSITGGNTGNTFIINPSGQIIVYNAIDHETMGCYTLTIYVSDGEYSDTANITLTVNDLNEPRSRRIGGSLCEPHHPCRRADRRG